MDRPAILIHLARPRVALGARARMALHARSLLPAQPFNQDAWMAPTRPSAAWWPERARGDERHESRALFASLSEADRATSFSHPEYGSISSRLADSPDGGPPQIHHLKHFEEIAGTVGRWGW